MFANASALFVAFAVGYAGLTLWGLAFAARASVRLVCRERLATGRALVVAAGMAVSLVIGGAGANLILGVWNDQFAGGFATPPPIGDPPKQLGFTRTPMVWLLIAAGLYLLSATGLFWGVRQKRPREAFLLAATSATAIGVAFLWWIVCFRLASAIIEALR